MVRQHDVVIADGTFRIVLTPEQRLVAALDAPRTLLGPLHIALEVDRGIHPDILRRHALAKRGLHPPHIQVGGIFDDIGKFVGRSAEGAFNTVSKAATTLARPVFTTAKQAVSHAMRGIAQVTPFIPAQARKQITSAARIIARARLGDLTAKQFVRKIAHAAKSGVAAARKVGDALLDGARLVARVVDVPVHLLRKVPGVGDVLTSVSPFQKFDKMMGALQRGDMRALKEMIKSDLSMAQGVVSFIPGIGTGISAGLSAGLAALEGGNPLEVAVRAAYGAIPIPPGIRQVTDSVLASVMELAKSGRIADVALAAARERVPSGLPRDVFDTLARILVKKVPVVKAAGALASHYVSQYAGGAGAQVLQHAGKLVDPKLADMARAALPVGGATRPMPRIFRPLRVAVSGDDVDFAMGGDEPIAYAVAGDEPVAYAVAGEDPVAYAVAGDEPVAGFELGGEDELFVGGEDAIAYAVAGEDDMDFGLAGEVSPELLARLPHESEWRTMRSFAAG